MNREQKLIDIMFEIAYAVHMRMGNMEYHKDIAPWIVEQLNKCGFEGQPMGMSWFVLKK